MKLINKLNIKNKLMILFLILFSSILILGYTSIQISENSKDKLKNVYFKSQEVLLLQENIIEPLYKVRELSQTLVMAPNNKLRLDIENELNRIVFSIDQYFVTYKKENINIFHMWEKYKAFLEKTKEYLKNDFEEGAYINVTTSSKQQFSLLINELLEEQSKFLNNAKTAYSTAVEKSSKLKIEILVSLSIILIFAIIIGWIVSNNIVQSIHKVQNGLNEFFEYLNNKKNKAKKIQVKSNDEFSQMANIINLNVENIQNNVEKNELLIKNATKVLENIKGGNLGTRLTKDTNNAALNELKLMMNDTIENLEDKIQKEINQRLEQEQILIQQSKLASMGEMIGNIAHQWRQPITEISAILTNMKITYEFDKFTQDYMTSKMKEANKLTSYMSETINDFQNFFNPQGEKELFSIEQACRDAFFIVESSMKYHCINVEFNVISDNLVHGFKNEYSQVILNILSNAKDIFIERKVENPFIKIEIKTGENYAIVKIEDNAGGIEDKILDKIFEPYFTTRHKTQGSGIGLYMSKNIIERNMDGIINVINKNQGACFIVKVLL